MWYHAFNEQNERIGYATSDDGISWTKRKEPVLDIGSNGSWDDSYVMMPQVIFINNEYLMWYGGSDEDFNIKIGSARSSDGLTWTKEDSLNPVMSVTEDWEDKRIRPGSVLHNNDLFMMWYYGGDDSKQRTGYATSTDGLNWDKFDTYVLDYGIYGEWDYKYAMAYTVLFNGDKYHMWYDSHEWFKSGAIGYATSLPVSVEKEISIPDIFELSQNYPNPFNPSTTLKYEIPKESYITLKVYDILGREVAILVNEQQKAGYYEVDWNAVNNSSGVYFYKIQAGQFVETKKMVLMK